jgi:hypothetical protein
VEVELSKYKQVGASRVCVCAGYHYKGARRRAYRRVWASGCDMGRARSLPTASSGLIPATHPTLPRPPRGSGHRGAQPADGQRHRPAGRPRRADAGQHAQPHVGGQQPAAADGEEARD